jgi:zinc D-Ala-D-Ala carboxypeptidase
MDLHPSRRLSPHFTLAELTVSATAARRGLKNVPGPAELDTLAATARRMEEVRRLLGDRPIIVLSGYRSPAVNRAVGGSPSSAHMTGHAVDFICPSYGTPAQIARFLAVNLKNFDQVIDEFDQWVHIGWGPRAREQYLEARKKAGRTVYTAVGK